jgi:serine/threonine protein phosphatase PrpC
MDKRVAGGLAITRAIGDHAFKSFGVTGQPYVVRHVLRPFDKYLVIASDGVWDTVSDQQAIELCKYNGNTKEIAKAIVKMALDKGSTDNIACMVLEFNSNNIF